MKGAVLDEESEEAAESVLRGDVRLHALHQVAVDDLLPFAGKGFETAELAQHGVA